MDIKKYIESGILELYVLGKLSKKESAEVAANAMQYPEIKAEIDKIELALENYALSQSIQPASDSFDKILHKIDKPSIKGKDQTGGHSNLPFILAALLFALVTAYSLYQNRILRGEKQAVETELQTLQADCDEDRRELNDLQIKLDIIRAQGNEPIKMEGSINDEEIIATVHWNTEKGESYLDLVNWPAPPAGQQYQLWAIVEDNPSDMDPIALDLSQDSFIQVDHIENAQAFAVSLEPEGGSPSPTRVLMIAAVPTSDS